MAAEERLGKSLPPSYRNFLKCTNGLLQPSGAGAARGGDFWPVEKIEWFRVRNAEWIEAYAGSSEEISDDLYFRYGEEQDTIHFRIEYLRAALELSGNGDSSVYLLNPLVVGDDGEWEAWHFANWYPGAVRYRSFAEMMRDHYAQFVHDGPDGF